MVLLTPQHFMTLKDSQNPEILTQPKVTSSWPVRHAHVCCFEINKLHAVDASHLSSTVTSVL